MNAMTSALKEAGVKTPTVMYRIWNWLKDHPEKTAEDITKALGMSYNIQTQLLGMERRNMLKVYKDKSRKTGIKGIEYMVKRYSVVNPNEYVLLPMPSVKTPKAKNVTAPAKQETPYVNPHAKPAVEKAAKSALTEAEQFAAYLEFKALMKEMNK